MGGEGELPSCPMFSPWEHVPSRGPPSLVLLPCALCLSCSVGVSAKGWQAVSGCCACREVPHSLCVPFLACQNEDGGSGLDVTLHSLTGSRARKGL